MTVDYILNDGIEFAACRLINGIRKILSLNWTVRWNLKHVHIVDVLELLFLRLCSTGHTRQLFVHAEVVLKGDRRKGLGLFSDLQILF